MRRWSTRLSPSTEPSSAEQRLAVLTAAGRILARSSDPSEAIPQILREVCLPLNGSLGVLWLVDSQAGTLHRAGAWRRPSPVDPDVAAREARNVILAGQDEAGLAFERGEAVWSEGAAAIPVAASGEVVGVLELVWEGGRPDEELRAFMEAVASQLGAFAQRSRVEERLRDTSRKYRTLVEQIPAITYTDRVDDEMSTLYISPQVETLLGLTAEEWIRDPQLWYEHLHPDDRDGAREDYLRMRESGGPFSLEYRMIARDGRVVWFRDEAAVLPGEEGHPSFIHGVMLDITERKQAEEQARFLAYHDKLTGLPNRAMFEELLEMALSRAGRHDLAVAVLCVDLDDFKLVNDSLGHASGDVLLGQVAERLRAATRESDLVARQGGDEFLLLLSDIEAGGRSGGRGAAPADAAGPPGLLVAESVANRIHESLRDPFVLAGTELFISASIGISLFPHDAADPRTLLQNADGAMYRSKRAAPGGSVVFSVQESDSVSRLSLSTRLRKAVERQHWVLHYQPVIDLSTREPVGVEALLRWSDPTGGLVAPGEFIPLAEEMGLIETIGEWVLGELCRQSKEWKEQGLELDVSFNLSPRELWRPDLVHSVLSHLADAGLEANNVIMEITESTAMTDPDRTQRILRELHGRGLRMAIDDFGTGYSSLSRLKSMPVDILKIDRSFVRDIPGDQDAGSMVKAIIQLARTLGMIPLAEGIETEEQWRFLVQNDCSLGQGYYFDRPMPASDFLSLTRRRRMRVVPDSASG